MGGRTTVNTRETSTNTPPTWAAPGLEDLGRRITAIIPTMPGPRYEGNFIAQPNATERSVPSMMLDTAALARQMMTPASAALQQLGQGATFGGPTLAQGTQSFADYNPTAVQPVVNAAIQPLMRQLTEQILPSIRSSGIESGAYGSDRMQSTLPATAIRDVGRQAMEVGTGIAYQDFMDQQNRNLQAFSLGTQRGLGEADLLTQRLGMTPDMINAILNLSGSSADITAQAGAMERGFDQALIEEMLARQDYNVRYPFQGLDVAAALLGNLAAPWGTRTSTGTQTQSTGGLAPIVGGLAGLGMMAAGFPGIGGLFGRSGNVAPARFTPPAVNTYPGAYVGWLGR